MKNNKYINNRLLHCLFLMLLFLGILGSAPMWSQTVSYSFDNAEITNDGMNSFYEADLLISADIDIKLGSGLVLLNFNPAAFGASPVIMVDQSFEGVDPDFLINTTVSNMGTPPNVYLPATGQSTATVFNVSWSQTFGASSIPVNNVTSTPRRLLHFRVQYVDSAVDPMISFSTINPGTQTLSSCGDAGFPFAPCSIPSDMTFNTEDHVFDNTGASIRCPGVATTWDGMSWNNGIPDATTAAILNGDYDTSVSGDINACELTINASVTLTITDGNFINIQNDIINNGTLQVDHQASVVQVEENAITSNNGAITVSKTTPSIIARNFITASSPMSGETRDGVYGASRAVFNMIPQNFVPFDLSGFPEFAGVENFLDDNNDYFIPVTGSEAVPAPGIGQWVFPSPDHDAPIAAYDLDYAQGTLNSGTYTIPIHYNGPATVNNFNLLGNPYASAIDVTAFITANDAVNEVYYWDHITNPNPDLPGAGGNGTGTSNFSMNDISMRNAMMGVAAVNGGTVPGGFMASGQGFGIKADQAEMASNTPVVFTNSIRVTGNNDDFRSVEIDKLWLNMTTSAFEGAQSQTAIGFTPNATEGFDAGYDSVRLGTFLSLFTNVEDTYLAIQGRESFDENMELTLGFSSTVDEEASYTISIDHFEGGNIEQFPIFLIDHLLGTTVNLKESDYIFTSGKTIQPDRFTVVFKEGEALNIEEESFRESIALYPNPTSNHITLTYTGAIILNKAMITDVQGKLVKEVDLSNFDTNQVIDIEGLSNGMYFMQIVSNEKLITKKIIKR